MEWSVTDILGIAFVVLLICGAGLVVRDSWRREGRWGVNPRRVQCPSCGARLPIFRVPRGLGQMLWGGWTCRSCHCRIDKWGRQRQ
jgi:hypothetical protein